MKVAELLGELQQLIIECPEAAEMTAVSQRGDYYKEIIYSPELGYFHEHMFEEDCNSKEQNAVCIN